MLPGAKSRAWGSRVVPGFPSQGRNLVLELDWVFFKTPGFFFWSEGLFQHEPQIHVFTLWHVEICFSACWPTPSQFPATVLIFVILEWKHQHELNIALSSKIRKGHQVTWSVLDGHVGVCPPGPAASFPFVFWIWKGKDFLKLIIYSSENFNL